MNNIGQKMDKIFLPYAYPDGKLGAHPKRWVDICSSDIQNPKNEEEKTIQEQQILDPNILRYRKARDVAYGLWQTHFGLKPKKAKFQLVQILTPDHSERSRFTGFFGAKDWWPPFQDCLFRVFVEPQTFYDDDLKVHKQWYVLCPEDSELVLRYEMDQKGFIQPPRNLITEKYFSSNSNINYPLAVPVECCRHFRHETTAGHVPIGL